MPFFTVLLLIYVARAADSVMNEASDVASSSNKVQFDPPMVHIPPDYAPVSDFNSHSACRYYASILAAINPIWCGPNNRLRLPYISYMNAAYSYLGKECAQNDPTCRMKFQCRVKRNKLGCPADVLRAGLEDRVWKMFCPKDQYLAMKSAHSPGAWGQCYTKEKFEERQRKIEQEVLAHRVKAGRRYSARLRDAQKQAGSSRIIADVTEEMQDTTVLISEMLSVIELGGPDQVSCADVIRAGDDI